MQVEVWICLVKKLAAHDTFSVKNSGVDARAHKDKLELKAVKDGSASYAALEKKAELYEKLVKGELSDEEDKEKYCVDFFRKGIEHEKEEPPRFVSFNRASDNSQAADQSGDDDNGASLFNTKFLGPGRTGGIFDNDEHKRFVRKYLETVTEQPETAPTMVMAWRRMRKKPVKDGTKRSESVRKCNSKQLLRGCNLRVRMFCGFGCEIVLLNCRLRDLLMRNFELDLMK